ncbi:winged helix-turn-helix domain-containing protein [Haloferax volcanii]|uniref:Winged helix-turn-helix domain-containing protein n=1 Tax=Haloferax volcanii TaxID=2246 RepID=A0A6C0UVA5_HALVO|nr:winged helix-turn-helix domain-containing protein [Haloferax alexandrinus]NLV04098.1 winged helix-turn-helix domain-containing protein [Haloferax alexandrinus]QIB79496.1 winged helix-turn-helix domain-containing protein [Haloferax alexandrinus]
MTSIQDEIKTYLNKNGRSSVAEVAQGIDYSKNYTRQNLKELRSNGEIKGEKTKQIPALIISGNFYVLTGDKGYLFSLVKRHASHLTGRARGMNVDELQSLLVNEVADRVVGGPRPWEFWK